MKKAQETFCRANSLAPRNLQLQESKEPQPQTQCVDQVHNKDTLRVFTFAPQ